MRKVIITSLVLAVPLALGGCSGSKDDVSDPASSGSSAGQLSPSSPSAGSGSGLPDPQDGTFPARSARFSLSADHATKGPQGSSWVELSVVDTKKSWAVRAGELPQNAQKDPDAAVRKNCETWQKSRKMSLTGNQTFTVAGETAKGCLVKGKEAGRDTSIYIAWVGHGSAKYLLYVTAYGDPSKAAATRDAVLKGWRWTK